MILIHFPFSFVIPLLTRHNMLPRLPHLCCEETHTRAKKALAQSKRGKRGGEKQRVARCSPRQSCIRLAPHVPRPAETFPTYHHGTHQPSLSLVPTPPPPPRDRLDLDPPLLPSAPGVSGVTKATAMNTLRKLLLRAYQRRKSMHRYTLFIT